VGFSNEVGVGDFGLIKEKEEENLDTHLFPILLKG